MKPNLKDFPTPIPGYEEYDNLQKWIEKALKWKVAFEKQLQERMKETQLPSGGYIKILEILGEK